MGIVQTSTTMFWLSQKVRTHKKNLNVQNKKEGVMLNRGITVQPDMSFMKNDITKARDTINKYLPQLLASSGLSYAFECGKNVYAPLQPLNNWKVWASTYNRTNIGLGIIIFKEGDVKRVLRIQMYIKPDSKIAAYPRFHPPTNLVEVFDHDSLEVQAAAISKIKAYLIDTQTHFCLIRLHGVDGRPTVYWADSFETIPESSMRLVARFASRADGMKRLNRLSVDPHYTLAAGHFHTIESRTDPLIARLKHLLDVGGTSLE